MSEEISPESEKMDISEQSQSTDSDSQPARRPDRLDNDERQTSTKNLSKCMATNSHPLMYSPDSEMTNKNFTINNFNPCGHSSTLDLARDDESLNLDAGTPILEKYCEKLPDFPESPTAMKKSLLYDMPLEVTSNDHSDTENDRSVYEAVVSPNLQNVSLTMNEKHGNLNFLAQVRRSNKLRKIKVVPVQLSADSDVSSIESISESIKSDDVFPEDQASLDLDMNLIKELLDSPDDIDDSVLEPLELSRASTDASRQQTETIKEYTAEEERRESRYWQKIVLPSGEKRTIDMRVIEPYKRVLSHGGYLKTGGHNAIIVFSACYLPDKSRKDYVYVMDNLFLYVLQTLDQLVTEDYVLVYLHGSASSSCIPTIGWLKRCYQLIDRKLRKNLKHLYLVHPTFWLKTVIMMTKPFISAKFYRKLHFINSIQELTNCLPLEQTAIPERVINYDKLKFST